MYVSKLIVILLASWEAGSRMDLDEGGLRNLAQLWQNCALKMMLQHTHDVILVQNEVPSVCNHQPNQRKLRVIF